MDPTTSVRVLFINEDVCARDALEAAMTKRGLTIDFAKSARDAVQRAETTTYAVVVVTHPLREMTALEVTEHILGLQPECVFIILTGLHHPELPGRLDTDCSIVALIASPWDDDELAATIRRAAQLRVWRRHAGDDDAETVDPEQARLLLIEESAEGAERVRELLTKAAGDRFRVDHVESLYEAMSALHDTSYLAVVAELSPPSLSGLDVVTRLHRAAPATAILALSGRKDEMLALRAIQLGAQDLLFKEDLDRVSLFRSLRFAVERKRAEQRLAQLAHFDQLTGLANRGTFHDHLQQCFHRAQRSCRRFAVMYVDLDHFKSLNDTYGHNAGDALLRDVGSRLQNAVRRYDTVGRLGGDEFALLLEELVDSTDVQATAERILSCLREPFIVNGDNIPVSASIGVAVYPEAGDSPNALLCSADRAMYETKSAGRDGYHVSSDSDPHTDPPRLIMTRALKLARARDELYVHYQPWVDLRTSRPIGFEALLRWKPTDAGFVPPEQFLPILEDTAMIIDIGSWVFDTACRQLRDWQSRGHTPRISVNLSPRQLQRDDLVSTLGAALAAYEIPPQHIEVEISEAQLMCNAERNRRTLLRLKDLGVRIVVDDFGSGSSSLSSLRRCAVDALKLDRSLIAPIGIDRNSEVVVSATMSLARELGLDMIAKGVERIEQVEWLIAKGCRLAQGYLIARPAPADGEPSDEFHSSFQAAATRSRPLERGHGAHFAG